MPLYEYKCLKCERHTDKIEPVSGAHLKKCPHCGGKVESVITAPAIKFKGSGWYVNDYAAKPAAGGDGKKTESGSSDSKDGKDSGVKESSSKDSGSKDSGGKDSGAKESSSKESKDIKSEKKK